MKQSLFILSTSLESCTGVLQRLRWISATLVGQRPVFELGASWTRIRGANNCVNRSVFLMVTVELFLWRSLVKTSTWSHFSGLIDLLMSIQASSFPLDEFWIKKPKHNKRQRPRKIKNKTYLYDLRLSQRWLRRTLSCEVWRCVELG
jgi:hypothetical protein